MTPKRLRRCNSELNTIWETCDYHVYQKLDALDHIVRCVFRDMSSAGIPVEMQHEFMRERFRDQLEQIAEQSA